MYLLYNFKIIPEQAGRLPFNNRAFQYNDGLFDTLVMVQGKIRFLPDHLQRMQQALQVLQIQVPPALQDPAVFSAYVTKLAEQNKLTSQLGRVKVHIWRAPGGLFTPAQNSAESLITLQAQSTVPATIGQADVATSVQNNYSALSFFKGPFATKYVLASLEKKQKKVDELILLSDRDQVSEVLVANIFWIKNNTVFTPALQTGCIAGIVRKNILRTAAQEQLQVSEGFYTVADLMEAEVVFTSNVTGLRPIQQLKEKQLAVNHPLLNQLNKLLFSE